MKCLAIALFTATLLSPALAQTGLTGEARENFIRDVNKVCLEQQRASPVNANYLMPCWYFIVIALHPRLQTRSQLPNYTAQPCKRKRTLPAVPAKSKPSRNFSSPANLQPDSRGMTEERFPYEHNVWHGGDRDAASRCALQHVASAGMRSGGLLQGEQTVSIS